MKQAVIIKIAADKYSLEEAKNKMISENGDYQIRGIRPEPVDGFWTAMFEKRANPFPAVDKLDTTNTSDVYGDSDELNVDAPTPSDDDLDLDDDMGDDSEDIKSVLADLKDVITQLTDAVSSLKGDHSEPDGDEDLDDYSDLDDVSFDDAPSADEVEDSKGKFISRAPKKLYRPKEAGIGIRQARSELLREMSQNKEYRNYRIASLEEVDNNFVATLEVKRPAKKRRK